MFPYQIIILCAGLDIEILTQIECEAVTISQKIVYPQQK